MAEESSEDLAWLLEPLAPRQVHIHVRVGDDAELDQEQRAALEELVRVFHEREAEGFALQTRCLPDLCLPRFACPFKEYSCNITRTVSS